MWAIETAFKKMAAKALFSETVRLWSENNAQQSQVSFAFLSLSLCLIVFQQTKLKCVGPKFMQMHACNLSQRVTRVPYCKGEGWRAKWSWDNQLSFIIHTFPSPPPPSTTTRHKSDPLNLHNADEAGVSCLGLLCVERLDSITGWSFKAPGSGPAPRLLRGATTNTPPRIKQMDGHKPMGVRWAAPGPEN